MSHDDPYLADVLDRDVERASSQVAHEHEPGVSVMWSAGRSAVSAACSTWTRYGVVHRRVIHRKVCRYEAPVVLLTVLTGQRDTNEFGGRRTGVAQPVSARRYASSDINFLPAPPLNRPYARVRLRARSRYQCPLCRTRGERDIRCVLPDATATVAVPGPVRPLAADLLDVLERERLVLAGHLCPGP